MKKIFILLFFTFFYTQAEIVIAFDTQDRGDAKKPNQKQLIDINKIKKIAKKHNIKVTFKAIPWQRSLLLVEKGKIDGVMNASYKTSRAKFAMYPMKNEKVNDTKRLNDGNSYFIYRHLDSPLRWDGTKFINKGTVAAMDKYAVIEDLEKHSNISIVTFRKNVDIVRQLSRGKFDAYAGSGRITDRLLKDFPSLAKNIIRNSLPIRKKPYFLIFSKERYSQKSNEMETIWNGLQEINTKK